MESDAGKSVDTPVALSFFFDFIATVPVAVYARVYHLIDTFSGGGVINKPSDSTRFGNVFL